MVNLGSREVRTLRDGWTVITRDKQPSAHYEHTIVVKKDKADILSDHTFINEAIRNNGALMQLKMSMPIF
jgi:methionyl aminopeptidase